MLSKHVIAFCKYYLYGVALSEHLFRVPVVVNCCVFVMCFSCNGQAYHHQCADRYEERYDEIFMEKQVC